MKAFTIQTVTTSLTTKLLSVSSSVADHSLIMSYVVSIPDGLQLWYSGFQGACFGADGQRTTNFSGVMIFDYAVTRFAPTAEPKQFERPVTPSGFARTQQHCGVYEVGLRDLNENYVEVGESGVPDNVSEVTFIPGSEFDVNASDVP